MGGKGAGTTVSQRAVLVSGRLAAAGTGGGLWLPGADDSAAHRLLMLRVTQRHRLQERLELKG